MKTLLNTRFIFGTFVEANLAKGSTNTISVSQPFLRHNSRFYIRKVPRRRSKQKCLYLLTQCLLKHEADILTGIEERYTQSMSILIFRPMNWKLSLSWHTKVRLSVIPFSPNLYGKTSVSLWEWVNVVHLGPVHKSWEIRMLVLCFTVA